jgi:hypothetical protein
VQEFKYEISEILFIAQRKLRGSFSMMEYTISFDGILASTSLCVSTTRCSKFEICKLSHGAETLVQDKSLERTSKGVDSQNFSMDGCSSKTVPISMTYSSDGVGTQTASSSHNAQPGDASCKIGGSLSSKATCISQETTLGVDIVTLAEISSHILSLTTLVLSFSLVLSKCMLSTSRLVESHSSLFITLSLNLAMWLSFSHGL